MIVYDDVANLDKIRIFDARVDSPPHYDTFAEFHYAYHYGDIYIPYVKQEEPLKVECQHFLDCIRTGATPISSGHQARDMVEILEAASRSLDHNGAPVSLRDAHHPHHNGNGHSPSRPVKAQIKATNGAEPVAPTPTESPRANGRKTSRKTTLSVKTP